MICLLHFPDFDNGDIFQRTLDALKPHGFADTSWHNDACPSLTKTTADHGPGGQINCRVFLNYADPSKREVSFSGFDVWFEDANGGQVADSEGFATLEGLMRYLHSEGALEPLDNISEMKVLLHGFTKLEDGSQEHADFDSDACDGWTVCVRVDWVEPRDGEPFTTLDALDQDFPTLEAADSYATALSARLCVDVERY